MIYIQTSKVKQLYISTEQEGSKYSSVKQKKPFGEVVDIHMRYKAVNEVICATVWVIMVSRPDPIAPTSPV